MSFELALIVALVPPAFFLVLIWKIDKQEHEPWKYLLITVALGAACALLALVLELAVDGPIQAMFRDNIAVWIWVDNFVGVALMEEISKMLVVMLVVWRHKEFNCKFDGVVYGAAASLGFAALENVKYVMAYGLTTGIVRAFTAIPGHFIFGIFMGACIGIAKCAKYDGKRGKMNLWLLLAILVPTALHGYYDYLLTVPEYLPYDTTTLWVCYLLAMVVGAVVVIIAMAKTDRRIDLTKDGHGHELSSASPAFGTTGVGIASATTATAAKTSVAQYPAEYADPKTGQRYILATLPGYDRPMYVPVAGTASVQVATSSGTRDASGNYPLPTYDPKSR